MTYPDVGIGRFIVTSGTGQCLRSIPAGPECWPDFFNPEKGEGYWRQKVVSKYISGSSCVNYPETIFSKPPEPGTRCAGASTASISCTTPSWNGTCPLGGQPDIYGMCCDSGSGCGDTQTIACDMYLPDSPCSYFIDKSNCLPSPVLIDVMGNGFDLTDAAGGVDFDIDGNPDHQTERIAWPRTGSDDAWLFFDRNQNGIVDSGRELFGNFTPQLPSVNPPNGFNALARFDVPDRGGNGDGVIDSSDRVFSYLRLWQDANHNGISEATELHTLPELGVAKLELGYKESKRTDSHGNQFRYRAKVWDAKGERAGRWAWDMFLVSAR